MRHDSAFMASRTSVATRRGWVLMAIDQFCWDKIFKSGSDFFPFVLIHKGPSLSKFCLRRQQSVQHTTQELCSPKLSKKCVIGAQPLAPQEPFFCVTLQVPIKRRSPRPFYLTENCKFWTILSTAHTFYHATYGFFLFYKRDSLAGRLGMYRTSQKQ